MADPFARQYPPGKDRLAISRDEVLCFRFGLADTARFLDALSSTQANRSAESRPCCGLPETPPSMGAPC